MELPCVPSSFHKTCHLVCLGWLPYCKFYVNMLPGGEYLFSTFSWLISSLGKCSVVRGIPSLCWFHTRNVEIIGMNFCSGGVMDNHYDQNICHMFADFECIIGVNPGAWTCYNLEDVLPLI